MALVCAAVNPADVVLWSWQPHLWDFWYLVQATIDALYRIGADKGSYDMVLQLSTNQRQPKSR